MTFQGTVVSTRLPSGYYAQGRIKCAQSDAVLMTARTRKIVGVLSFWTTTTKHGNIRIDRIGHRVQIVVVREGGGGGSGGGGAGQCRSQRGVLAAGNRARHARGSIAAASLRVNYSARDHHRRRDHHAPGQRARALRLHLPADRRFAPGSAVSSQNKTKPEAHWTLQTLSFERSSREVARGGRALRKGRDGRVWARCARAAGARSGVARGVPPRRYATRRRLRAIERGGARAPASIPCRGRCATPCS